MYNQQIRSLIYKYERLKDFYDIGPVQKCVLEDFVNEIIELCADQVCDLEERSSIRNVFNEE